MNALAYQLRGGYGSSWTSSKCPYRLTAYRSACARASGPVKMSNSLRPSSSNHSTRHRPGLTRSSKTLAGSAIAGLLSRDAQPPISGAPLLYPLADSDRPARAVLDLYKATRAGPQIGRPGKHDIDA